MEPDAQAGSPTAPTESPRADYADPSTQAAAQTPEAASAGRLGLAVAEISSRSHTFGERD